MGVRPVPRLPRLTSDCHGPVRARGDEKLLQFFSIHLEEIELLSSLSSMLQINASTSVELIIAGGVHQNLLWPLLTPCFCQPSARFTSAFPSAAPLSPFRIRGRERTLIDS
jgi:hypothetical protein